MKVGRIFFHEEVTKTFRENSPIIVFAACSNLKWIVFLRKLILFNIRGQTGLKKNCSWFKNQVQRSVAIQKFHKLLQTDHNRLGSVATLWSLLSVLFYWTPWSDFFQKFSIKRPGPSQKKWIVLSNFRATTANFWFLLNDMVCMFGKSLLQNQYYLFFKS